MEEKVFTEKEYDEMIKRFINYAEMNRILVHIPEDKSAHEIWESIKSDLVKSKQMAVIPQWTQISTYALNYMCRLECELGKEKSGNLPEEETKYKSLYLYLRDDLMNHYNASIKVLEDLSTNPKKHMIKSAASAANELLEKLVKNMAKREIEMGVDSSNE